MTRSQFFKHFDLLADQPDAVAKMRELVLELAVRGLLVERDPTDEVVAKLLGRIRAEKQKFLAANKLKEPEALSEIDANEAPFNCPASWQWVRLGTIANRIHYGYTASADHLMKDVRLLRITDIQDNQVNWETVPGCQISGEDVAKYELHENDILIARTGGTIGKTFLVSNVTVKAVFASYLIRVIPSSQVCAAYLKLFLESGPYWLQLRAKSAGTGQPNVNGEALSRLCVSLPPLAEQRRIVAKVDELMALCDELAARQQARHAARAQLQQSALHHLLAARDPQTFAPAWQRVRDQFHLLHDTPDALPQLRQAILQLAVQGRLVPQNQIEWREVRLDELGDWALGCGFPTAEQGHKDKPILFAKVSDMNLPGNEKCLTTANNTIDETIAKRLRVKVHPVGTVVFPKIGGAIATNKRRIVVRPTAIDNNCLGITPATSVNSDWLYLLLTSMDFAQYQSGTSVPALNQSTLGQIPVLLPPLAEQKRIVARVEALLRQCDALEVQLHQTRTLGTHLLAATLHRLLAA